MRDENALMPLLGLSAEENFIEDVKRALIFIGKSKPEALRTLFEIDNISQKRFITEVAAHIASPAYYSYFDALIDDRDGHLRSLAAIGLSKIGDKRAIPQIMKLLSDPYEDVQESAVSALGNFREDLKTEEFVSCLKDKNPALRKNCALVLGKIGAKDTVDILGFALKDEDTSVRQAAVNSLSSITTDESVRYLICALTDENQHIRTSAALSLGAIGGEKTLEPLMLLLSDNEDSVRAAAARALGMTGDADAVKYLIDMLQDPNGFVVTTAMEALSKLRGGEAREALIRMLDSNDTEIKRTAIKALSSFQGIQEMILPYLWDPDWATRVATLEVLSKSPTEKVISEVARLADSEDDPVVRKTVEELFNVR
jgi:HEAT repeat protein